MKTYNLLSVITLSFLALAVSACKSSYPDTQNLPATSFNTGKLLFDNNGKIVNAHGAGFVFANGKYYMFGEHKLGGTLGNRALVGVHCYSSTDLYNWKDEGIALEVSKDPESPIVIGTVIERPKVVFNKKTKKFVMFMHIESRVGDTAKSIKLEDILKERPKYKTNALGIAIADKPQGPYKFLKIVRPNANKYPIGQEKKLKETRIALDKKYPNWRTSPATLSPKNEYMDGQAFLRDFERGQMSQDFTVFVDDDEKAYLFSASENDATLHIHELDDEYLNFTGKFSRQLVRGYHEAPAVFKTKGKYYMFSSHCTGWRPNPGRISVAETPFGEWIELGNPCRGEGQKKNRTYPEAKADTTFRSQPTFVIKLPNRKDSFIYVGDRWKPDDAVDGRYIFLPVEWEDSTPIIRWKDSWDLSFFDLQK